ncbi:hypothetical protein [Saccharothrix algeriensis]|uniref:Uncharacterized protein n=1 Tax=Saccharothrix algeriensis TaxID=173560 RepID=A0A8T8I095_9PSEU|nr:hypothetical protein [Saccharothrix algeriensis]MBM7809827.1 hypothetical protein [Saccharothrix algeriensis]QTR04101.1 hypothetical protein J7S33_03685 [Saccharothrix algeriensis]
MPSTSAVSVVSGMGGFLLLQTRSSLKRVLRTRPKTFAAPSSSCTTALSTPGSDRPRWAVPSSTTPSLEYCSSSNVTVRNAAFS